MKDQSKKPVSHTYRASQHRLLRTLWGGALVAVAAGGLVITGPGGAPAVLVADTGPVLRAQPYRLSENVPIRQTETAPRVVSLDQIEAVLERAEQQSREQGQGFSPTTAQAAAELGMLYTTYRMQQAISENDDGPRVQDVPREAAGPAVPVSYKPASVTQARAIEPATAQAEMDRVTFGQLVVAAERLANLLDSSLSDALVEVQRPDELEDRALRQGQALPEAQLTPERQGSSLRQHLLDVVSLFGGSTLGYANGRIPADVLCPLAFAPGHMLRCDAAQQLTALSDAFEREFGYPIPITDSYRPYVQQVVLASTKPHLAAVPGTSNHGWGLAVDLSDPIAGGTSREYTWLRVHGPDHGWDNPSWARPDGTKPEPWHFEFFAAGSIPNRAVDPSDVGTRGTGDVVSTSDRTNPRHEPARDTAPKDGATSTKAAEPPAKPAQEPAQEPAKQPAKDPAKQPGEKQPPQRPAKPAPKPDATPTPTPSEPKPKPPPRPAPSPTPSPSPSEPGHGPSPSPAPSVPTPTPSDDGETQPNPAPSPIPSTPSPSPTPSGDDRTPTPSPSPSDGSGPVSRIAKELGLTSTTQGRTQVGRGDGEAEDRTVREW